MRFSLIICTFMRPLPLLKLLQSVKIQTLYPDEILIIDGSLNFDTKEIISQNAFPNLQYFMVDSENRGLTRQRNFGISKTAINTEIVCFLDDDTILEEKYFEQLIAAYQEFPKALGIGGYISNEVSWQQVDENFQSKPGEFVYDGWKRTDGSRFILRKKLGLDSNLTPGFMPEFGHGRSIGFLPPSGKIYEVEQLMGGVSSFRTSVFEDFQFSNYFQGYGLYEDADFTLRLSKTGKLYINTNAKLSHFHDNAGRPNRYQYGRMVIRNGWHVWRVKHPAPSFKNKAKWYVISLLLSLVRFSNIITASKSKEALTEFLGRMAGLFSLILEKPYEKKIQ